MTEKIDNIEWAEVEDFKKDVSFERKEKWISKDDLKKEIEIERERRKARRERDEKEAEKEENKGKKGVKGKADKMFIPKYAGAGRGPPIEESGGFCYGESKDIEIIATDDLSEEIENYADGTKLKIGKAK